MTGLELLLLRCARWLWPALAVAWALGLLWGLGSQHFAGAGWLLPLVLSALATHALARWADAVRERFNRENALPQALKRKLRETFPHLGARDAELAERALRQFFIATLRSRGQYTAVPTRAADVMWEVFAHHAQAYAAWCRTALGHVPDHSPVQVLGKKAHYNDGLRRTWYWACCDESIDPRHPSRLPLLFAIDAKLDIPDGLRYAARPPSGPVPSPVLASHYGTSFAEGGYSGRAVDFGGVEPRRKHGMWEHDGDSGGLSWSHSGHGGSNADGAGSSDGGGDGSGGGD